MHLQQTADAFAGALSGVVDVASRLQDAGIHADVGDVADEWVGHDFEGQRGKWRVIGRAAQLRFVGKRIYAFERRHIHRRRKIIDDRVEQRLDAFILERRTREHRHDLQRQGGFADRRRISSSVSGTPLRYLSIKSSSCSAM